ncbi:F-box protein [Cucumis melo var. makuwa]|uniref:F-box protein n=1 Tax=Cucumis melo var. makuwa TaxID=1194695 RepID=A0A5A7UG37_CUCMM|nr:F-box protein [Cucumis melo var. makuwa]
MEALSCDYTRGMMRFYINNDALNFFVRNFTLELQLGSSSAVSTHNKFVHRHSQVRCKPQVRHKPPLLKLCYVRTPLSSEVASIRHLKGFHYSTKTLYAVFMLLKRRSGVFENVVFGAVMRRLKMKSNRLWVDQLANIFAMITSFTDLAQACGICRKWKEGVKLSLGRRNSLSFSAQGAVGVAK